jgi:hypothetical protein
MDDLKELLTLAARACGLTYRWSDEQECPLVLQPIELWKYWHPAEVPGDGAEMEDKLRISVMRWQDLVSASSTIAPVDGRGHSFSESYADHPDEGTARRWASLRVAAAIGRSMK